MQRSVKKDIKQFENKKLNHCFEHWIERKFWFDLV